ncbi:MAG: hypothetical protein IIC52_09535 [Proteobacteria bacterium]|nr:hypothetical protein [Pseudomonadota bacterium]
MDWEKIKPALWGIVGGAIAAIIIGFAWGGWVTGGTAENMAEVAVADRLAPICVEQFNQDSKKDQNLKELKKTEFWMRGDYVAKQGWATMPGEKEADSKVAEKCADLLVKSGQ